MGLDHTNANGHTEPSPERVVVDVGSEAIAWCALGGYDLPPKGCR